MSITRRELLARVGTTDVFVEQAPDSAINRAKNTGLPTCVHLRLVDMTGERFTKKDLEWMALDHNTLHELLAICNRKRDWLCTKYLPECARSMVTRMQCWVGPDGIADIEFLLSANSTK